MAHTSVRVALLCVLLSGVAAAQDVRPSTPTTRVADELEPHVVGAVNTTWIGAGGYMDRFYSSERILPSNYSIQVDLTRFVSPRIALRGGLVGSASVGGDDADERPTGLGTPAIHATGGAAVYFTPAAMWSPYTGAEYWLALTSRASSDRGSVVGLLGLQGALSSRVGLFIEGSYGVGLTGRDEQTNRLAARAGVRIRF